MADTDRQEPWTPSSAPRERIEVDGIVVRRYVVADAEALAESITESIDHLRPWMPWIAHEPVSIDNRRALIAEWSAEWDARRNFTMGIFDGDLHIGGTGLHLRNGPGVVEIGYWIRVSRAGQGVMTRVVGALVDEAFAHDDIDTIEIHHDAANRASGRIPEKLGFSRAGERQREPQAPAESGRDVRWVRTRER